MNRSSVEYAKLKLLSLSKKRVDLALSGQWESLALQEAVWQRYLEEVLDKFGDELQILSEQLMADNDELSALVKRQQTLLNQERKKATNNLSKVQKYLK